VIAHQQTESFISSSGSPQVSPLFIWTRSSPVCGLQAVNCCSTQGKVSNRQGSGLAADHGIPPQLSSKYPSLYGVHAAGFVTGRRTLGTGRLEIQAGWQI